MTKPPFKLSNINIYEIGWLVSGRVMTWLNMRRLECLRNAALGKPVTLLYYRMVNHIRYMASDFQLDCEWAMGDSLSDEGLRHVSIDFCAGVNHYRYIRR